MQTGVQVLSFAQGFQFFFFFCHVLRVRLGLEAFGLSPNVFMLAHYFSTECGPDVFLFLSISFSFFSELKTQSKATHGALVLHRQPQAVYMQTGTI